MLALWPLWLLLALIVAIFELRRGATLTRLVPFIVLAAIHGTLLSQLLWGSTYALWPLLMVLIAAVLSSPPTRSQPVVLAAAAIACTTFLVLGTWYAVSLESLSYIQIPEEPRARATAPGSRRMATPGPFLRDLDELLAFSKSEVPQRDSLLLFPGEDPFYFASGRIPYFPVTLFDRITDPYSATELFAEAQRRDVRWVIVKRFLQIKDDPLPEPEQTRTPLMQNYSLYRKLRGYDVYHGR